MTEEDLDSGSEVVDGGSPNSQVATKSDKPGSGSVSQSQDVVEERLKRIEKMVSSMQSGKDRGIDAVKNENAELRKSLGELQALMKKGLSEDEAFEQLGSRKAEDEFRTAVVELRDALRGGKSPSPLAGGAFDPTQVITDLGLDLSDPVVKVAFEGKNFTEAEAEAAAARILREKKRQPNPTQAQSVSTPAASVKKDDDLTSLQARYDDVKKFPLSQEYKEVKKKLDERGWK